MSDITKLIRKGWFDLSTCVTTTRVYEIRGEKKDNYEKAARQNKFRLQVLAAISSKWSWGRGGRNESGREVINVFLCDEEGCREEENNAFGISRCRTCHSLPCVAATLVSLQQKGGKGRSWSKSRILLMKLLWRLPTHYLPVSSSTVHTYGCPNCIYAHINLLLRSGVGEWVKANDAHAHTFTHTVVREVYRRAIFEQDCPHPTMEVSSELTRRYSWSPCTHWIRANINNNKAFMPLVVE